MATYPHEETPLTEHEKAAYRYLLYCAMLGIRMLCQPRLSWNPKVWQRQYRNCRIAGSIANWLHNRVQCSFDDSRGLMHIGFGRITTVFAVGSASFALVAGWTIAADTAII